MNHVNPTREQFKALFDLAGNQPIHALNLIRFNTYANYESVNYSRSGQAISGQSAYWRYSQESEAVFHRVGGDILWSTYPIHQFISPQDEVWDLVFIARYPSVQSFIDLIKSDEYQKAAIHRTAAVADSRLSLCIEKIPGNSFAPHEFSRQPSIREMY